MLTNTVVYKSAAVNCFRLPHYTVCTAVAHNTYIIIYVCVYCRYTIYKYLLNTRAAPPPPPQSSQTLYSIIVPYCRRLKDMGLINH